MLEEKNDNLSIDTNKTDGTLLKNTENQDHNSVFEKNSEKEITTTETENTESYPSFEIRQDSVEEDNTNEFKTNSELKSEIIHTNANEVNSEKEVNTVIEMSSLENEHTNAVNSILNTNAEEGEEESFKEKPQTSTADYDAMAMEDLVSELEQLIQSGSVLSVKEHIEEVKKSFLFKYQHFIEEKREQHFASQTNDNTSEIEEFQYDFPLKKKFDQLYNQYRDSKNAHFKSLQNNLKANLENRMAIVEELKTLVNQPAGNISNSLKQINDIRERWKNAGPIPKDKYNHVWNNYHFYIDSFYDYLHLDREARDQEFKHNFELKSKIIERTQELVNESDISKAFRELQDLHKIWKEVIGPVSKEHREDLWNQFSSLTKQLHDKREAQIESFREKENLNLEQKNKVIEALEVLANHKVESHAAWAEQVEKVEALRNEFFAIGRVPNELSEATWSRFKNTVRDFNLLKNSFYKEIKKGQNDNLTQKQQLVEKANELKDSEDFEATTPLMKQIQEDWKKVGHVPRKYSDKLWSEFRAACNHYFDRLKESKKEENEEEVLAFEKKKEYLENLKSFELVGDHKTDLEAIKAHIEAWKLIGRVPINRRHVESKFNKILDALFEKLSTSKKESDQLRFANRLDNIASSEDSRKLENEKIFISRKIEEVQNEIFQLENNIQFFQNTKNAKKENSIVTEVRKTIDRHREDLETWKDKLQQIKKLIV